MVRLCLLCQKLDHSDPQNTIHRCPDDGSRAAGSTGESCAVTPVGVGAVSSCPSSAHATNAATQRNTGGAISERYPLGKDRQSSVAATNQQPHKSQYAGYHPDRYLYNERTACSPAQLGSTNRYSTSTINSSADRYTHGSLDRYHTNTATYSWTPTSSSERWTVETTSQATCTLDRYTPTERHRRNSKSDVHKIRERSTSSDRKERLQRDHPKGQSNQQYERPDTPSILACPPAPAPFGSQSSVSEPPSPAPACDRFVAPPPADGETETTDCYAHGTFPSPIAPSSQERFSAPPLPASSPTEDRPTSKPNYHQEKYHFTSPNQSSDKYHQYNNQERYQISNSGSHTSPEGYCQPVNNVQQRFTEGQRSIPINAHMPVERYVPQPQLQEPFYNSFQPSYERYSKQLNTSDPYMRRDLTYHYRLPVQYNQNQCQKIRYSHMATPSRVKCCQIEAISGGNRSSPGSSSSASSITSGGHTSSLQDIQCQNYQTLAPGHYQQEKGTQCPVALTSRQPSTFMGCRHGGCEATVEYVGVSGGRRICATPPPRPQERCEGCIQAAAQAAAATVAAQISAQQTVKGRHHPNQAWRSSTPNIQTSNPQITTQQTYPLTLDQSSTSIQLTPRHILNHRSLTPTTQRSITPTAGLSSSGTEQSGLSSNGTSGDNPVKSRHVSTTSSTTSIIQATPHGPVLTEKTLPTSQASQTSALDQPSSSRSAPVQRAVSMPAASTDQNIRTAPSGPALQAGNSSSAKRVNYSQSERVPIRPPLNRSFSRREIIKNYIKRETANFFGVDGENEDEEKRRWLNRRKRMASRTMGPLKDEYSTVTYRPQSQAASPLHIRHRRAVSEATQPSGRSGQMVVGGRPDILPGDRDITDGIDRLGTELRRKDSVARMTWDGLNYVVTTLTRHRPRPRSQQHTWSRSFPPDVPQTPASESSSSQEEEAEAFFERPGRPPSSRVDSVNKSDRMRVVEPTYRERDIYAAAPPVGYRRDQEGVVLRHPEHRDTIGSSRIASNTLDNILDNSDRREYGMGWVGRMFGRSYRKSVVTDAGVRAQLDDMDDHRPYFTYWVTSVQVLVLYISIICYGLGPFGIDLQARSGQVLVTSLSLQQVDYLEPANFWGGPRAADLIHLGAKFAPCMRMDDKIFQQVEKIRKKEKETACCIRNDDSGCVQSSQADCSKTISTWKKWTSGDSGPGGRISGSVCGLDPKYCDAPASVHPYEWPDDITKWPICRKINTQISNAAANRRDKSAPRDKLAEHMVCEVIGHPCCIGIHGQCRITTREYCDFVRGAFHEEASLCSQVSCLNDVCGMIPFYFPDAPDQFYRLWTSLFLHAGQLQLLITILVQYFLMRDLEKLTGSMRIGIIYIGSGVAGNLASAIFVPYRADVGPAGSQFGLLACLIVEVLNAWPMLKHPDHALAKLLMITLVLFLIGLLPWVDNYAHLFGFLFGFLLSYALLPFVSFGQYDRNKKIFLIWVCLLTAIFLFILLVLLFYIIPVYDCQVCSYFNCLPLTKDFCASQNINFKREEPIV